MNETQRKYTAEQKAAITRRHLNDKVTTRHPLGSVDLTPTRGV
jgi:hypothetical protein